MFIKGIKIEMYRAIKNKLFLYTILASSLIGICQFLLVVLPGSKVLFSGMNITYPKSVFNMSMIFDVTSSYSTILYYSLPLFCAIPYATSYFLDLKNGYVKNICTRYEKKSYLIGKYISVFVSAGITCTLPIIINLLLTMTVIPDLIPEDSTFVFPVTPFGLFHEIYYSHPYVYVFLFVIIAFIICGLLACSSLAVSRFAHNRFIVLFTPFALFFLTNSITQYTTLYKCNLFNIMNPIQNQPTDLHSVIYVICIMFFLSFGIFYYGGKKSDIF